VSPQQSIAHYRVTSKLGEGGMGEVWRATDTKLGRDVAVKILPESFATDADRLARFTREAQVLASLNHPNIAAIYGVEDRALVLELVEGPTLADRIAQGPMPLDEVLSVARQIAEALEYAHEKGVIHRDLKPANIKVTPEGRAKVLDFGLAKALAGDPAAGDPRSSPTLTMRSTMAGVIMGTAAYMSPEQAKGKPVDRRADIWAFGVVLVEMLTGKSLYTGETVSETLAAVILKEPDLGGLTTDTPAKVKTLLRRCLDRDSSRRLRDIGEARIAIDEILAGGIAPDAPAATVAAPLRAKLPWTIAGILALGVAISGAITWRATHAERPFARFVVDLGAGSLRGAQITAILSPDNRRLLYTVRGPDGVPLLATRLLDQAKPSILAGTERAEQPFFSPDSEWIGFFADQKLKKVSVQGGRPVYLCDSTAPPRGATWTADGNIIANLDNQHLTRMPAAGGKAEVVGRPEAHGDRTWRWPQALGKGDLVLFTASNTAAGMGYEDANIDVLSLKTGEVKVLQRGGYFGRYLPSGHLVYLHEGALFALPFDLASLQTRGTPLPVIDDVAGSPQQGGGQFGFSDSGSFVYLNGKSGGFVWNLSWVDASGKADLVWSPPSALRSPKISPDSKRIAGVLADDVVVYDLQRSAATRLTFAPENHHRTTVWSVDGKHLVYADDSAIWWIRADGASRPEKLLGVKQSGDVGPTSFSPDGKLLAYTSIHASGNWEIWTLPLDLTDPEHPKPGTPQLFQQQGTGEGDAAFSPDGRWLAYASFGANSQVFVQRFPGGASSGKWQISADGGRFPMWSRTSPAIFFLDNSGRLEVAAYTAKGDSFAADKPRVWGPATLARTGNAMSFDVAPDGKRFLLFPPITPSTTDSAPVQVTLLLNFFDELKRRLP
jgi:Tol biopolymer transport system component